MIGLLAVTLPYAHLWSSWCRQADPALQDESFLSDSHSVILCPSTFKTSPITLFPDGPSLLRASPTLLQEDVVLRQGIDNFGWHVRCPP